VESLKRELHKTGKQSAFSRLLQSSLLSGIVALLCLVPVIVIGHITLILNVVAFLIILCPVTMVYRPRLPRTGITLPGEDVTLSCLTDTNVATLRDKWIEEISNWLSESAEVVQRNESLREIRRGIWELNEALKSNNQEIIEEKLFQLS